MNIDLRHYGSPLKNNKESQYYNIEIKQIKHIEVDIDMVYITTNTNKVDRFRFSNKRFSNLFKRKLENGY